MRLLGPALYSLIFALIFALIGMPAWSADAASAERVRCAAYFARGAVSQWTLPELLTIATSDELATRAFRDLPWFDLRGARIQPAQIPLADRGNESRPPGTVLFEGRLHFVKIMKHSGRTHVARTAREAFWLLALNRLGRGPRFRGLARIGRGNYGIVMERVSGGLWRLDQDPPEMLSMGPDQFDLIEAQLSETIDVLSDHGIYAFDLQLLVDTDARITLIDPSLFEFRTPPEARNFNHMYFNLLRAQLNKFRRAHLERERRR